MAHFLCDPQQENTFWSKSTHSRTPSARRFSSLSPLRFHLSSGLCVFLPTPLCFFNLLKAHADDQNKRRGMRTDRWKSRQARPAQTLAPRAASTMSVTHTHNIRIHAGVGVFLPPPILHEIVKAGDGRTFAFSL
jgi:hypothetical protein